MNEIKFYRVSGPYGFLSNFSPHPIYVEREMWATVEHYFQASKFENNEVRKKIKSFNSPMKAAQEGRSRNYVIRADWESVKDSIMLNGLIAKFLQHQELKVELLKTEDAILIEDSFNDSYWANGGDGKGKNRLGKLLMDVREIIITISNDTNIVFPPWMAFPELSQYDIFWRMGLGEEYLTRWSQYYLSIADQEVYKIKFPENENWEGIYD
ncbi:NADAR family protein [Larkinella sp.]|uniref:NADAR family protein n=1 Tax=Larkinella sp. TaxID=2034517 RepID=UPI003BA843CC